MEQNTNIKTSKNYGIKVDYTLPYNPQQNEVAKRKNRTINKAAKAMMHDQNLHITLWAKPPILQYTFKTYVLMHFQKM